MSHSQFFHSPAPVLLDGTHNMIELDARGLRCPMPLLRAKQALNKLAPGESLLVKSTDPGSERDFHAFARLSGHHITYFANINDEYHYVLQKSPEQPS